MCTITLCGTQGLCSPHSAPAQSSKTSFSLSLRQFPCLAKGTLHGGRVSCPGSRLQRLRSDGVDAAIFSTQRLKGSFSKGNLRRPIFTCYGTLGLWEGQPALPCAHTHNTRALTIITVMSAPVIRDYRGKRSPSLTRTTCSRRCNQQLHGIT